MPPRSSRAGPRPASPSSRTSCRRAEIIDISKLSGDTVKFGAKVTLIDEETDEKTSYQIVGEFEADVKKGKISVSSPIARAIIGKKMGDSVEVNTPGGGKSYEIAKVAWRVSAHGLRRQRLLDRRLDLRAHGLGLGREPVDEAAIRADQVFVEVPLGPAQHARLLARPFVEGVRACRPSPPSCRPAGR